jgi:two-component system sensor histidine kinase CpxA
MQKTVDEILELNRLQNQHQVDFSKFEIYPLVDSLLEQSKKESPKLTYYIDGDQSLSVSGNASLIKRVISNILNNAQRYAKTTINIKLTQKNKETIIVIEDDGDGIADDKLLDIFSPFSTLDDSRSRKNSGIGLGLAIVKLIIKKHAGDVIASRSDLGGARFKLHWGK